MDYDVDVIGVVEGLRAALECGVVEPPISETRFSRSALRNRGDILCILRGRDPWRSRIGTTIDIRRRAIVSRLS
jgi:hypothetical protein